MRRFPVLTLLAGLLAGPAAAQDDPMNPWLRHALRVQVPDDERTAFRADFLYWFLDRLPVPPLVTTGPAGSQAVVGEPGTRVLRGGELASRNGRYVGLRLEGDWWLSRTSPFGVTASGTFLERDSSNITFRPGTVTPLARPYLDAGDGRWKSFIVAGDAPEFGPLSGSINVYSRMELFHQDVNLLLLLRQGERGRLCLLAGAHFAQLRERLDITGTSRVLPDEAVLIGMSDHFQTFNKFYGGQLGLRGELRRGRWSLAGKGVLAYGADHQIIRAKGDRVFHTPLERTTEDFGLYVQPSNTGSFARVVDDLMTEWGLTLGAGLTSWSRLRLGYTLLTWGNPVRPGDQIEPVNLTGVGPGPTIPFRTDFFWAQGLHLGLEARW